MCLNGKEVLGTMRDSNMCLCVCMCVGEGGGVGGSRVVVEEIDHKLWSLCYLIVCEFF